MRPLSTAARAAAFLLSASTALTAQIDTEAGVGPSLTERDWRLPFRSPSRAIDPPRALYEVLNRMLGAAEDEGAVLRFDERGIEVCDSQVWRNGFAQLQTMDARTYDIGYLSQIIRESGSATDRKIALYGMFYHPNTSAVMQMLNHIPGEPSRRLREAGYRRAIEYMRVHYRKKNEGNLEDWSKIRVGPGGQMPPKPGEWSYEFDAIPYFMLLQVDSPLDQRQALWFLGEVVKIRPHLWQKYMQAALLQLYHLAAHDDRSVRQSAIDFLARLDPESRSAPAADDGQDEIKAWIDAVAYDVFPPIRPVSPGLTELYPSDEVTTMLQLGEKVLRNSSLGQPATGKFENGYDYRGLRIDRMPTPLDKLGFEVGNVVISINGQPVASCADVLRVLEALQSSPSFLVEFVHAGKRQAREIRRGA